MAGVAAQAFPSQWNSFQFADERHATSHLRHRSPKVLPYSRTSQPSSLKAFSVTPLLSHRHASLIVVTHDIRTTGPPVSSKARRLAHLQIARCVFDHMLQLGIVRPSSSCWATPSQRKRQATGCGDYCAFNNSTLFKTNRLLKRAR